MTLQVARQFNVPEADVIRALPPERVVELDASRWREIIVRLEQVGPVHVIVSNGATTIEAMGIFGGFSTIGEFFNVQTKSLDLHIRWAELGAVFAVEKPGHLDKQPTKSVQFFDRSGAAAFKVFLNFDRLIAVSSQQFFDQLQEQFRL